MTEFRGRALPEPAEPADYAALIARYDLDLPLPVKTAAIAARHHPASTTVFPRYWRPASHNL